MRSKLFVPGTRPDLFPKAFASAADAISLDLEDAVAEGDKDRARSEVAAFLRSEAARASSKQWIVRCNAPESAHFEADVEALLGTGLDQLNIPKLRGEAHARETLERLADIERRHGAEPAFGVLANVETPGALIEAAGIATAGARIRGLQLGLADLFEELGIARDDAANVHAVLFQLRLAAGRAGLPVVDGAYPDLRDVEGFEAEARMARRLGFAGKSCIHPSQIAVANRVFAPTEQELAWARRVLEAAVGQPGVFVLDGRMIDRPFIKRAEQLLADEKQN
jgi:citrate lyase subunit beta/citryl-CoA lyase